MRSSSYSPILFLCPLIYAAPNILDNTLLKRGDYQLSKGMPSDWPYALYNGDNCLTVSDTAQCQININIFGDGTFLWGIRNNNCDKPFGNSARIVDQPHDPSTILKNPVGSYNEPPNAFTISNLPKKSADGSFDVNAGFQLQVNEEAPVKVEADNGIDFTAGKQIGGNMTLRNVGCYFLTGGTVKGKCYVVTHKC